MFHSPEIQRSLESLEKNARDFVGRLDQVSEDIKKLEATLTAKMIPLEVCIGVTRKLPLATPEHEFFSQVEHASLNVTPQEWVGWGRDEKSARMRLLHFRVLTSNGSPLPKGVGNFQVITVKPLIEATTEERLRCYPKLSRLLTSIGSVMFGDHVPLFE